MSHNLHISFSRIPLTRFFVLLGICVLVSSCNITKFLSEDELVVDDVNLSIEGDGKAADAIELKDELEKFYRIRPNKNRKSYNYYKYKDVENPRWIKRWLKKRRSEKPSLVDTSLIEETSFAIGNYLRNKKGYYEAELTIR